jgi:polyisoprenoid-binding protein YceI
MPQLQTEEGIVRVPAGTWRVDPAHSSVAFEVQHMMISTVRGTFEEFDGTLEAGEDVTESRASGWVKVASIDTNNPDRDEHLRSPDFFDVEHHPDARYESTSIRPVGGPHYEIVGDLTIKGITRPVTMEATVQGAGEDPWGNERVGVSVRGVVNRKDFGLTWQQRLASGSLLVGEDVRLLLDISAVRA